MAAFEYCNQYEMQDIETITEDGLTHFSNIFKMSSVSFIASCAIHGDHLDEVLFKME